MRQLGVETRSLIRRRAQLDSVGIDRGERANYDDELSERRRINCGMIVDAARSVMETMSFVITSEKRKGILILTIFQDAAFVAFLFRRVYR